MPGLNLTPRRLELLAAIGDPHVSVYFCHNITNDEPLSIWRRPASHPDLAELAVTTRAAELEKAGLIRKGPGERPSMYARRPWELTDAGCAALDAAKES